MVVAPSGSVALALPATNVATVAYSQNTSEPAMCERSTRPTGIIVPTLGHVTEEKTAMPDIANHFPAGEFARETIALKLPQLDVRRTIYNVLEQVEVELLLDGTRSAPAALKKQNG